MKKKRKPTARQLAVLKRGRAKLKAIREGEARRLGYAKGYKRNQPKKKRTTRKVRARSRSKVTRKAARKAATVRRPRTYYVRVKAPSLERARNIAQTVADATGRPVEVWSG